MPVLFNQETQKAVAFRCAEHRDAPVHNLNADDCAECATCALFDGVNQGADQMFSRYVAAIVDSAATQLEFFSQGAGENFRRQAAQILQGGQEPENQEPQ